MPGELALATDMSQEHENAYLRAFSPIIAMAHGEHQPSYAPNQGFDIRRQEYDQPVPPVPPRDALPLSYAGLPEVKEKAKAFAVSDMSRRLLDGETPLVRVETPPAALLLEYSVDAAKYRAAVADGRVAANLFGTDSVGRVPLESAESLDTLVGPEEHSVVLEAALKAKAESVVATYLDDLGDLSSRERSHLQGLVEAYDLHDGDGVVRLLNFATPMTTEQLRQAVNAVRATADKSGGDLYDRLRTIVIMPEEAMTRTVRDEQGEFELPYSGEARGTSLFMSGRLLQPEEERAPRSERVETYYRKYFDKYRVEGEPTEGPLSPADTAGNGNWEKILAHELEHIALAPNNIELPGDGPTLYSRVSKREGEAELGSLAHMGGVGAFLAPAQRKAKAEMWWRQRGSDDGITYRRPLGPHFIRCLQLDTRRPLPPRLRNPQRTVSAQVTYHLTETS